MCREPVTFGGGITIVYEGRSLPASARKYPADTHRSYLGCSTSPGTYWAGRCGRAGASGVVVTVRVYGCTPTASHARFARRGRRRVREAAPRMAPAGRRAAPDALALPVGRVQRQSGVRRAPRPPTGPGRSAGTV